MTARVLLIKKKQLSASITVTMTLVLFLIVSIILVTLEHAYVYAGRTIAFQTTNKAMESALGMYYAPLYTQYGLLAIPMGESFYFEDEEKLLKLTENVMNSVFNSGSTEDYGGFLWNMEVNDSSISSYSVLTDNSGQCFQNQVEDEVLYDVIENLGEELSDLSLEDILGVIDLLNSSEDELKEILEEVANDDEENDEDEETKFEDAYNSLKLLFTRGFPGLWFEDIDELSTADISQKNLPSYDKYGEVISSDLFDELTVNSDDFGDGSYLQKLINDSFIYNFEKAVGTAIDGTSDKAYLTAYALMNFDSYTKDEINGKLDYEQEYLIFGNLSDNVNVKKTSWSIFGIRLITNLIYILTDPSAREEIQLWAKAITTISKLAMILMILAMVVMAVENAIVETAAILNGKSVDFMVNKYSQCVSITEIFSLTKNTIEKKVKEYEPSSYISLDYQLYIAVFMMMTNLELLRFRMMDLIQINMQKLYNKDFLMKNCITGFGYEVNLSLNNRYVSNSIINKGADNYSYNVQSAVFMP